jgi:acetolactate synthase-1/2/3 large subunit
MTGAEAMVRMLDAYGVRHVFGLCGDTSLPWYDALARLDHGIRHVLTRDERSAAYMADAYARVSGRIGVCEGPSGGGATYILPGVAEANDSSVPVLAITTDVSTVSRGRYTLTELDQLALMRPLTKWNAVIERSDKICESVRAAFRAMSTGRPGAAHLGFPLDVQRAAVDAGDAWAQPELGAWPSWRTAPDPGAVAAAVALLREAKRPLLICGGGVVHAGAAAELLGLAERVGAAVATTVSGKGAIADDHPLAVGVVGSNGGTPMTREIVSAADLVMFVACRAGSVTTEKWRFPARGVPVVHVDVDPAVVGANYPTRVAVVGDARLALQALLAELGAGGGASAGDPTAAIGAARARKFEELARHAANPAVVTPERLVLALQCVLPADAVVVADAGTPCPYLAAYLRLPGPRSRFVTNRAHGALGYSLPAVLGAHLARPEAKSVAVMGDGSFGFACGELETLARLRAPVLLVVVNNGTYGWIKAGQRTSYDRRYFSVDFTATDNARIASAFGVRSWRVEDPGRLDAVLAEAVAHRDGPALVDVVTQPLHEAHAPVSEWIV